MSAPYKPRVARRFIGGYRPRIDAAVRAITDQPAHPPVDGGDQEMVFRVPGEISPFPGNPLKRPLFEPDVASKVFFKFTHVPPTSCGREEPSWNTNVTSR